VTCSVCKRASYPWNVRRRSEDQVREARAAGWYIWRDNAPIAAHGLVVCPDCIRSRGVEVIDQVVSLLAGR
jgi:hypothetical protein